MKFGSVCGARPDAVSARPRHHDNYDLTDSISQVNFFKSQKLNFSLILAVDQDNKYLRARTQPSSF